MLKVPPFEEFDSLERFERFQKAHKTVMKQIQRNEIILITGEGTIHDLRKGPKALLYLAHICKKFLNKHVEIINHSAYPEDDLSLSKPLSFRYNIDDEKARQERSKAQLLYQKIYNEIDFVAIREPISYDVMSQLNVVSTLSFDCLPLYINDHYHTPKNVHNKTVVIAKSAVSTQPGARQICRYLEYLDSLGYHITAVTDAAAFASDDEEDFITFLKSELTIPLHVVTASSIGE